MFLKHKLSLVFTEIKQKSKMKRQTCFVWKSRLYLPHQVFTWFHFNIISPWISSPAGSFQSGDLSPCVSESFHKILFIDLTGAQMIFFLSKPKMSELKPTNVNVLRTKENRFCCIRYQTMSSTYFCLEKNTDRQEWRFYFNQIFPSTSELY